MNRPGMTLVETAVAMMVAAFVILIGFGALGHALGARSSLTRMQDLLSGSSAVRQSLLTWLTAAEAGSAIGVFIGEDREIAGKPDDVLTLAVSHAPPFAHHQTLIRLRIDRDDRTAERGLVVDVLGRDGQVKSQEIAADVMGMDAHFLARDADVAQPWLASWNSSVHTPRAVRLHLFGKEPASLPPLLDFPILAIVTSTQ